jgi:hypothetical protein
MENGDACAGPKGRRLLMTLITLETSRRLARGCCVALALLLAPSGCFLLGGKSIRAGSDAASSNPKVASRVSFHNEPGQAAGPSVTDFKVGQPIYAVVHLEEPAGTLVHGDGNLSVDISIGGSSWGGISVPLTAAQKNSKEIEFAIISEDLQKHVHPAVPHNNIAASFMNWLNDRPRAVSELTVTVGSSGQASGAFKLDLSAGADGYASIVEANQKIIDASTADTPIPEPGMKDAKLEAQVMATLKREHPKIKYYKVIITGNDWRTSRNEATGIIEGRRLDVAALAQSVDDGKCAISKGLVIYEEHQGGGKYGNAIQAPGGKSVTVPCERFASFGAPK